MFDAFLGWLDSERENAGLKYEEIRRRLIKIFSCRGCLEAEDLADETINRVIRKLPEIEPTFIGEPSKYFFGVANKIYKEQLRQKKLVVPPGELEDTKQSEQQYTCLEHCMEQLTAQNKHLVLEYYKEERQAKIQHRKQLAEQLGIALNALRIRAHRIRSVLENCVEQCLDGLVK